ncbi:hypothetical protein L228DRAFT_251388 [Xylona heveae TC161]|uniref:Transferase family protein n=1 Tax=Xylona heveae (strain CBS 132557 / TC161) TaxID=1328760 RepID=A0A164ZM97_XYLHT|nr:hypothetical protein L228DRAFT_251388 [Xylona heveae TC161]KZF19272.1 hypothetical protein L228DRAFT_251388 [Xylona heveae TC161]
MSTDSSLSIHINSQSRLFPTTHCRTKALQGTETTQHTIPLSILDATVANFAATAGVWIYDPPSCTSDHGHTAMSAACLKQSLQETLNAYPHWAGQLEWTRPQRPHQHHGVNDHTQRHGRVQVTCGSPSDPGVEFVEAYCDNMAVKDLVPSGEDRAGKCKVWDVSSMRARELFPSTVMALRGDAGAPGMKVQITTFADAGIAIAIMFAHPLADAQAMSHFMHDWAAVNAAMVANAQIPALSPVFDPSLLDLAAAGDIDSPSPDAEIVNAAQELPVHRFDWWASEKGCPDGWDEATKIPEEFAGSEDARSEGKPMPWSQWNIDAPVGNYLVHFTGKEITRIWKTACATVAEEDKSSAAGLPSRHDAILAHMWILINRARDSKSSSTTSSSSTTTTSGVDLIHLDLTLGVRSRVSPKLSERFVGSPIFLAHYSLPLEAARSSPLGKIALGIRGTTALFTTPSVAALLHEKAHQVSAQRYWDGFCGRHHVIVTSWAHLNVYQVDFVGDGRNVPRYVLPLMPDVDGCLQLMEARPNGLDQEDGVQGGLNAEVKDRKEKRHWTDNGVDVKLQMEAEALQRLLNDPLLRKYA